MVEIRDPVDEFRREYLSSLWTGRSCCGYRCTPGLMGHHLRLPTQWNCLDGIRASTFDLTDVR